MAYKDILKKETYSYIDNVSINKNLKLYSFTFYLYENENKENLILEKTYNFHCKDIKCKTINKIYSSKSEITESLKEVYYNNDEDEDNTPNFYNIEFENYIELDEDKKEIKKTRLNFTPLNYINYFIYKEEYYLVKTKVKVNGLNTDHYFDNVIYPSINKNIIEVLYNTLEIIEPSYKDYPKI